ncbi:MAG TPA: site-specific DNA-methyltransferase [Mollicutes bacterium]|nr:site-specific DNA-methyltransferase [Mollicutes bacterium]
MKATNLSKQKRENMLKTLNEIKKKITDDSVLQDITLIENELNNKKYGLIWEEHQERVDVELQTQIPIFENVEDKKIYNDKNNNYNFLLEGDNLHSLYLLEKTHKGKIDVIYIDPPYNTGKKDEWMYNDCNVDLNDDYKHSKWLSFISKRLEIAKKVIAEDGYIVISIDDNEYAQLKLLCDDVFGENNFICNFVWQKNFAPKNDNKYISTSHEYILMYSKNKDLYDRNLLPRSAKNDAGYSNPDDDPRGSWASGTCLATTFSESGVFKVVAPNGKKHLPPTGRCWRYSEQKFKELMADNRIWFGKKGDGVPRVKRFLFEMPQGIVPQTWLKYEDVGSGQDGTKNLKDKFNGEMVFNFPKPVKLIKFLIDRHKNKNAIVLDFFAGSGTTAQAVLELNKEDGGNRQFILCTNNENNICEDITYQRIKTVITGKRKDESIYSEGIPANLKYFKTSYVPKINTEEENLHTNLLVNIKNLIELENGIDIDDKKIRVYLNEKELDSFSSNEKGLKECEIIYISSDVLLSQVQEQKFRDNNIKVFIIPEYYFKDEIMEVL